MALHSSLFGPNGANYIDTNSINSRGVANAVHTNHC